MDPRTDSERTARLVAAMWATDRASRGMGMVVEEVRPGAATLSMTVAAHMVNSHEVCHGGYVASLADSAFAYACNAYGEVTVASGFDVSFVAPALLGDVLVATAVERHRRGRSGLYDVTVRRRGGDGEVVAELRGRSRSLGRPIVVDRG